MVHKRGTLYAPEPVTTDAASAVRRADDPRGWPKSTPTSSSTLTATPPASADD